MGDGSTPTPWDVWREPTETREAAIAELTAQVEATEPFAGSVWLLNAGGKCPATTGCGPTSEANARRIVASVNATAGISVEALEAGCIAELVRSLENMTNHYIRLVDSGDAGSWNPRDEPVVPVVLGALATLAKVKGDAA